MVSEETIRTLFSPQSYEVVKIVTSPQSYEVVKIVSSPGMPGPWDGARL